MKKVDGIPQMDYVQAAINNEGLDYALEDYSDFSEVEDNEFHRLRKEYLKIAGELRRYVSDNLSKDFEEF